MGHPANVSLGSALTLGSFLLAWGLLRCSPEFKGCDEGECGNESAGGEAGAGGEGAVSAGGEAGDGGSGNEASERCDPTQSPHEEVCLVDDRYAVFVAPAGDDEGDGSRQAPLASMKRALELSAGKKLILVCNAEYDERVVIAWQAVVYGGFACDTWQSESGAPLFRPSTQGPALRVDGAESPVSIERVDFQALDAVGDGASSLAALIHASPQVRLREVQLMAGTGTKGADGAVDSYPFPSPVILAGNSAASGGDEKVCECQAGLTSTGGRGADGSSEASGGLPDHGTGGGEPGLSFDDCTTGTGKRGADAPPAANGPGAVTYGLANADGWFPRPGVDGEHGLPGQGGGGGGQVSDLNPGAGGGCGGCGGSRSTGGQGGGGSIALLSVNSGVTLEACTLQTDVAGAGGSAPAGTNGQMTSGMGGFGASGCDGGNGGFGGKGGAGGGGAGGISVGIVSTGSAPSVSDDTLFDLGEPGLGGAGGADTNDGIEGIVARQLSVN